MTIFLAAFVSIAAATTSTDPKVLNRSLFSGWDYPIGAVLLGQQGRTQVRIEVDANGKAGNCTVATSSGSAALDATTCRIYRTRARFAPAKDNSGKPIASAYVQSVNWVMNDIPAYPMKPWSFRVLGLIGRDTIMRQCGIDFSGALKGRPKGLGECSEMSDAIAIPPGFLQETSGQKHIVVMDQQFVPRVVNSIDTPSDLKRYRFLGREVAKVRIGADGLVKNCVQSSTGAAIPSELGPCATLRRTSFAVPEDENGKPTAIWGTTSVSMYALRVY